MALFGKDAPKLNALTAAATRLQIDSGQLEVQRIAKRREAWQDQAWLYFDAVGEVKYACDFLANSMSKCRLYVAEQPDAEQEPVPTDDDKVIEVLSRLRSPVAGYSQLLRALTLNLTIPGECYLVGLSATDDREETWDIYSLDELKHKDQKFFIVDDEGKETQLDADNDFVLRIWLRHPRHRNKADSSLHGVLEPCEDLLIFGRADRAVAKSRIAGAGIMKVPNELSFGGKDATRDEAQNQDEDPFLEELIEAMITPIKDEGSASSVVPMVVRGAAEHLKGLEHMTVERPFDKELDARMERAQKRLAQGINVPVEVIFGLGQANHWGAGAIEESVFTAHLEPLILVECDALTVGYLHPQLKAEGIENPEKYLVWYDASKLIVRPNRSADADNAHDRNVISDEAYRREKGFDEDDRITDPDELARRMSQSSAPEEPEGDQTEPPEEPEEAAAVTAASTPRRRKSLGRRLTEIDRTLRALVLAAADAAMQRALEKAGAKLRSKARKDQAMTSAISGIPSALVASTLGPGMVAALGVDDAELLDDAFESIRPKFFSWVARAQDDARNLVPAMTKADHELVKAQQLRDLDDSWRWLSDSLAKLAKERLYNPAPAAPVAGEFDASISIPQGLVREALARAGGADGIERRGAGVVLSNAGTMPVGGVANGQVITNLLEQRGGQIEAWEWIYGEFPREHPFEPHADLDGLVFEDFTATELQNPGDWPDAYLLPGDHAGCACDVSPAWVIPEESTEPVPALAAAGG